MSPFDQVFEINEEDLDTVLCAMDLPHDDSDIAQWWPKLNFDQAVEAALRGDDMDEQALAAHENLREQIIQIREGERLALERQARSMAEVPLAVSVRRRAMP
jgi:hypothetical protein